MQGAPEIGHVWEIMKGVMLFVITGCGRRGK